MWRGNPALTAVLFGLPLGFFSLICYSICCADIMDAEEEDDDGDDLGKPDLAVCRDGWVAPLSYPLLRDDEWYFAGDYHEKTE